MASGCDAGVRPSITPGRLQSVLAGSHREMRQVGMLAPTGCRWSAARAAAALTIAGDAPAARSTFAMMSCRCEEAVQGLGNGRRLSRDRRWQLAAAAALDVFPSAIAVADRSSNIRIGCRVPWLTIDTKLVMH